MTDPKLLRTEAALWKACQILSEYIPCPSDADGDPVRCWYEYLIEVEE